MSLKIENKTPIILTTSVDLGAAVDNFTEVFPNSEAVELPYGDMGAAYALYCGENVVFDTTKLNSTTGLDNLTVYYKTNSVSFTHYQPQGTVTIPRTLIERIAIGPYEP